MLPRDDQIILIESTYPIKSKKILYYSDSTFTRRLIKPTRVPTQEPYDPNKVFLLLTKIRLVMKKRVMLLKLLIILLKLELKMQYTMSQRLKMDLKTRILMISLKVVMGLMMRKTMMGLMMKTVRMNLTMMMNLKMRTN